MKYCSHCGAQLTDDSVFCFSCGKAVGEVVNQTNEGNVQKPATPNPAQQQRTKDNETMKQIISVFLILACVVMGICTFGIGLAWCIPMTISIRDRMRRCVPVGVALKVCTLLFVSTVAGILLLCLDDELR